MFSCLRFWIPAFIFLVFSELVLHVRSLCPFFALDTLFGVSIHAGIGLKACLFSHPVPVLLPPDCLDWLHMCLISSSCVPSPVSLQLVCLVVVTSSPYAAVFSLPVPWITFAPYACGLLIFPLNFWFLEMIIYVPIFCIFDALNSITTQHPVTDVHLWILCAHILKIFANLFMCNHDLSETI